jgi:tRNA(Arg) A34 adenosine deaminase TadA
MESSPELASLRIDVPAWVDELVEARRGELARPEQRMALAIALSRANVERGGGPFGAVVFAGAEPIAAGVNLVLSSGFSIAHAEIVAIMRAQRQLSSRDVPRPYTLYTSAEPCCQCFGALIWSGLQGLVCAANTSDVESVGFDEGPKPQPWQEVLARNGFAVAEGLLRPEARAVLDEYKRRGGPIYGLRGPSALPSR